MKRVITATYQVSSIFIVPDNVKLNPLPINPDYPYIYKDPKIKGDWWIKWDTLFYIDENLQQQEIEADCSAKDAGGFKNPTTVDDDMTEDFDFEDETQ